MSNLIGSMGKAGLLAALMALSVGSAQAQVSVTLGIAPPLPMVVLTPEPRVGFLWVPGYWNWRNHKHVWVNGVWLRNRPGYRYQEPRWAEQGGRWQLQRGGWQRGDKDHDGVPNSVDRDRDGDGLRNSRDGHPNHPRGH